MLAHPSLALLGRGLLVPPWNWHGKGSAGISAHKFSEWILQISGRWEKQLGVTAFLQGGAGLLDGDMEKNVGMHGVRDTSLQEVLPGSLCESAWRQRRLCCCRWGLTPAQPGAQLLQCREGILLGLLHVPMMRLEFWETGAELSLSCCYSMTCPLDRGLTFARSTRVLAWSFSFLCSIFTLLNLKRQKPQ